jgi:hypothetical protein
MESKKGALVVLGLLLVVARAGLRERPQQTGRSHSAAAGQRRSMR